MLYNAAMKFIILVLFYFLLFLSFPAKANVSDGQEAGFDEIKLAMQNYLSVMPYKLKEKKNIAIGKTAKDVVEKKSQKKIVKSSRNKSSSKKRSSKKVHSRKNRRVSYCLGGDYKKLAKKAKKYDKLIATHSAKNQISESLVKAIITAESCFNERAESPKGARGLMQLMPATGKRFGTTNRFDPNKNIKAGTRYLKFLLDYFEEDLLNAIAAYNAGEGAVNKYNGIPPYKETRLYVRKVAALYKLYTQGGGVLSSALVGATNNQALIKSIFVPRSMPRSRFSPYKGRAKNIERGRCANRTSTRLKKSTQVESGRGIWQRVYVARRGDTMMRVMHKTGVHKNKIAQMNGLRAREKLKAGQRLLVWECRK